MGGSAGATEGGWPPPSAKGVENEQRNSFATVRARSAPALALTPPAAPSAPSSAVGQLLQVRTAAMEAKRRVNAERASKRVRIMTEEQEEEEEEEKEKEREKVASSSALCKTDEIGCANLRSQDGCETKVEEHMQVEVKGEQKAREKGIEVDVREREEERQAGKERDAHRPEKRIALPAGLATSTPASSSAPPPTSSSSSSRSSTTASIGSNEASIPPGELSIRRAAAMAARVSLMVKPTLPTFRRGGYYRGSGSLVIEVCG